MRTRIKICGVTSVEIAAHAARCGADAIGLNFYPGSSRYLERDLAATISDNCAPFVSRVGVFADAEKDFVCEVIKAVELDYLQFHGSESPSFCASFQSPYIKAIRVGEDTDVEAVAVRYPGASAFLLDTYSPDEYGGTGDTFNWDRARINTAAPVILAGGLTPENVAAAVEQVLPYGVDVSSGVETGGEKDPDKISKFCQNVNS